MVAQHVKMGKFSAVCAYVGIYVLVSSMISPEILHIKLQCPMYVLLTKWYLPTRRDIREKYRRVVDATMDMRVDPNEPVYCVCRRVAFGDMIACDNPEVGKSIIVCMSQISISNYDFGCFSLLINSSNRYHELWVFYFAFPIHRYYFM
jgi:hypothetical protein